MNRCLAKWGYDRRTLAIQQPVVHFQASYASECWQFDVRPSDRKALPEPPPWIDERWGRPVLMLYSVVEEIGARVTLLTLDSLQGGGHWLP